MTQLDVLYRFGTLPSQAAVLALDNLRKVYGIRSMELRELDHTVRIEYDSTRLTEPVVQQLLRRAGLNIIETVPLSLPPAPAPAPSAV